MQTIPLVDSPSQTLNVALGGQACRIDLRQSGQALYCDLYVSDALVIGGVVCQNFNPIKRSNYLGFSGDLYFVDTQGSDDPISPGLGTRFVLTYIDPIDIAAL